MPIFYGNQLNIRYGKPEFGLTMRVLKIRAALFLAAKQNCYCAENQKDRKKKLLIQTVAE